MLPDLYGTYAPWWKCPNVRRSIRAVREVRVDPVQFLLVLAGAGQRVLERKLGVAVRDQHVLVEHGHDLGRRLRNAEPHVLEVARHHLEHLVELPFVPVPFARRRSAFVDELVAAVVAGLAHDEDRRERRRQEGDRLREVAEERDLLLGHWRTVGHRPLCISRPSITSPFSRRLSVV
jgi:hypothetical protein